MDQLLVGLRAAAEITRIRILFVLSHGEFNVSELTQILGQSQPRVSRHLKLMAEAGLLSRYKEGNWVLFRLREDELGGSLARSIVDLLPGNDALLARDRLRIEEIRSQRAEVASRYFGSNAERWEKLRSLHIAEAEVESTMRQIIGPAAIRLHVDLGTGTGNVLRSFAHLAKQSIGIDSSHEMLAIARANLGHKGLRHAQIRHGDIYALPFANSSADLVTIHQVLHYLDDPARALIEAVRILEPKGRLLVADFAPHDLESLRADHAHRRLGIAAEHMSAWLSRAGAKLSSHRILPPAGDAGQIGLTVSIWLAEKVDLAAKRPSLIMSEHAK
jgi:ubiquinone/menaquinone biosynthesis C-methylase UbiE